MKPSSLIIISLMMSALAVPPAYADDRPLTQDDVGIAHTWDEGVAMGEAALKDRLIDPDSAVIDWPYNFTPLEWKGLFTKAISGYFTCGTVNSRNRMGGYAGRAWFQIMIKNHQVIFVEIGRDDPIDPTKMGCERAIKEGTLTPVTRPKTPAPAPVPPMPPNIPHDKPVLGFGYTPAPDGAYIITVAPGSAAEAANLKPGMVITAINGINLKGFDLPTLNAIFSATDGEIILEIVGVGKVTIRKAVIGRPAS